MTKISEATKTEKVKWFLNLTSSHNKSNSEFFKNFHMQANLEFL